MAKKRNIQSDKVRPFAGQPFAFVGHTHRFNPPTVADLTARDAIDGDQRYDGAMVYVTADQTTYQLRGGSTNAFWTTLVTATGIASHTELGDIGTNTHAQIDSHIADATLHFTEASINITESQISDLQAYALTSHLHTGVYLPVAGVAVSANALASATTTVNVSSAAAPTTGQVLKATGPTTATWQTLSAGSGDIVQTGTPLATHVGYFTADKNLSGSAGLTWINGSAQLNIIGATPSLRIQDNDSAAGAMVASLDFWSSTALVAQMGFIVGGGNLALKNTAGNIVFDTNGTATVAVTGDGDINIGGYIAAYAGTPADGSLLTWVTANSRAEFVLSVAMTATGTPVDNQIATFDSANSADGDPNFTWNGVLLTAGSFTFNNANDQFVFGGADLSTPGIEINGSATASPFINLQQNSVTQAVFRYSNASSRTEISSVDDDITFRPGNVDTLTLTGAVLTMQGNIALTGTVDGRDVLADGTAQDSHIADGTIHFSQASISITASQVSDFDSAVSGNAAVAANTAKVSNVSTALSTGTVTGTTYGITSDGGANDVVLPVFNSTEAGLVPGSGGGTTNFLRADGTWAAPPGGSTYNIVDNSDATFLTVDVNEAATFAGNVTVEGDTLSVGVDDTTRGNLHLFGPGTGSSNGGEILMYLSADDDTTFEYIKIDIADDDLRITDSNDTFITRYRGDTGNWDFPAAGAFIGGIDKLTTSTGVVSVAASAAPSVGQTLVATSATVATWQTPSAGGSAADSFLLMGG